MQDSLSFALTQISYLVFNINKRNFSQNVRLINKVSVFLCEEIAIFLLLLDSHFCVDTKNAFGHLKVILTFITNKNLNLMLTMLQST